MRVAIHLLAYTQLVVLIGASGCMTTRPINHITAAVVATPSIPGRTCDCSARQERTPLTPSALNKFTLEQEVLLASFPRTPEFMPPHLPRLVKDAPLQHYIEGIMNELLAQAPDFTKKFAYRVILYRDPFSRNAYACPGGTIFISLEIIEDCEQEGALAGVIAHEIGHIGLRHSTAMITFEELYDIRNSFVHSFASALEFLFSPKERHLQLIFKEHERQRGVKTPAEMRRWHETEADIFSVQLLSNSRFHPEEFRHFHEKSALTKDRSYPHHDTHPLFSDRAKRIAIEECACEHQPHTPASPSPLFATMRNRASLLAKRFVLPPPQITKTLRTPIH